MNIMPEIAEVETITREIRDEVDKLYMATIDNGDESNPGVFFAIEYYDGMEVSTPPSEIKKIYRRGKNIIIETHTLNTFINLGMSGRLHFLNSLTFTRNAVLEAYHRRHTRGIMSFTDRDNKKGFKIIFTDFRRFGKIKASTDVDREMPEIKKLGFEIPLGKHRLHETFEEFAKAIRKQNSPISVVLVQQNLIAGIGNYLRSEILFTARVNPFKKTSELSDHEISEILDAALIKISEAVAMKGCTLRDFRDIYGNKGSFQHCLQVYGRKGTPCPTCKTPISTSSTSREQRIYFCSRCQGVYERELVTT